jgi:hypothetical protein
MASPKIPLELRFEKWTKKTESGCWEWLGQTGTGGYAFIKHNGKKRKAATVAFEFFKGPIPEGLEISHVCPGGGNVLCVNPDHLVAETHSENLKRRRPFDHRTYGGFCKKGHLLPPPEERNQNQSCPTCYAEYQANWKAKNPDANRKWREANKDSVNANRRARRAQARREGRKVT